MSSFIQGQMREESSQREQVSRMLAQQEPPKFKVGENVVSKRNGMKLVIVTTDKNEFNNNFNGYDKYTCKDRASGELIRGYYNNGDLTKDAE